MAVIKTTYLGPQLEGTGHHREEVMVAEWIQLE